MFKELKIKSAIHYHNSKFATNWDLNIYRGCEHKCKYCFAQYSHKFLENNSKNFFDDVYAKINVAEVLDKELSKKSWKNTNLLNISGVSDCYQPAEKQYQLMRKCLEILIKHKQSTFILTKSPLILRDIDLIEELSKVAYVNVAFTITSLDEKIRQKIEPNVIDAKERLKILEQFTKIGCKTTIMLMPIIPYLTDTTSNLENIFKIACDIKCNYLLTAPLNMRGFVKDNFYDFLKINFPITYQKIQKLYKGAYASSEYETKLNNFIHKLRLKYNIFGGKKMDDDFERYVESVKKKNDLFY